MKWWLLLASVIGTLITAWLILYAGVRLSTLLSLGLGAISLIWLVVLLTVPWNLYFAARRVAQDIPESRERGIEVPQGREDEARDIARRMVRLAIAGHIVSAAVLVGITFFSGAQVGYYFAAFYLLATCFRPVGAYLSHLRRRVTTLAEEVRYPRRDVVSLAALADALHLRTDELGKDLERLREEMAATRYALETADHDLNRRMTGMTRRFDETVDGLGDNQEVISGLKAFLRLIRAEA
ncbi:hypothetical protein AB0F17_15175 [Nonomuraea sp. NPDC026600]|uniref:hypothetical protein n=1 Tax=Nonomuraea sp. NPDC026600 TaxID=3155363 RepID=UPI0033DC174E